MTAEVQEVMGDYGVVSMSERVLQKVWLNRNFDENALATQEGNTLRVLEPGEWNRGKGPDFKNARFIVGNNEICGDVEIHFNASDWIAHKHHLDPEYNNVRLHVVLYPSRKLESYTTLSDVTLHSLCLLPLLHEDLELLSMNEALMDEPEVIEMAAFQERHRKPFAPLWKRCVSLAYKRWDQKVSFAKEQIRRIGWEEACHFAVMDALGYSKNRVAMRNLAMHHPLDTWRYTHLELLYSEQESNWCLSGVRPFNHPRTRLRQYMELNSFEVSYPLEWLQLQIPEMERRGPSVSIAENRKKMGVKQLREEFGTRAFRGIFGGNRLDTLIHNVLLPYLSAKTGSDYYLYWFYWYAGDYPAKVKRINDRLISEEAKEIKNCNGIVQSVLQTLLEC
jgi:hypothetical protein